MKIDKLSMHANSTLMGTIVLLTRDVLSVFITRCGFDSYSLVAIYARFEEASVYALSSGPLNGNHIYVSSIQLL